MAALRTVLAVMVFATSAAIADDQRKADALHMQAVKLEMAGKNREAVKQYIEAARLGSAKAAWRLGEIYDKGIPGISRDYAESLKWLGLARRLDKSQGGWGCPPNCVGAPPPR